MKTLYDIINILPLALLSVMLFGGYAGMPESSLIGYAVCLLSALWFITLRNMKRRNKLRSVGIVSVFLILLMQAAGEEACKLFFAEYFWTIWMICFSASALIAGILMERNIWIKRAIAAAMLIYSITGTVLEWKISKEVFGLICLFLLICAAEEIQRHWTKSGDPDLKAHITRTAPVFLAVCLLVYLLPAPDTPYDWQFAKDIWQAAESGFTRLYGYFTHSSDDYGTIGFSDKGGFFSGLNTNDDIVLSIDANYTSVRNFRLIGCISGDFRDREWIFDTETESNSRMLDALETECAVRKFDYPARADYLQKTDMECENYFYNTKYLFAPAKIRMGTTINRNNGISEKNGSIVSERSFLYQDKYAVSSYVLNYSHPQFTALLNNAAPITEEEWTETARTEDILHLPGYSFADYQAYRQNIREQFCHTYGLSDSVQDILDEIRHRSETQFDAMKLLEAYLRELEYSTDCGALPENVTDAAGFLDHFLFSAQKGYCMHFATAFVLMANEMGIPCRYVQGYLAEKDANGSITVKQSNAHAWPEVYFENAGWIAFEPTPVYANTTGWAVSDGTSIDWYSRKADPDTEDTQPESDLLPENAEEEQSSFDPLIIILPSLGVICFLLVCFLISRLISRRKYRRMQCKEKYKYLTQHCLRLLGYLGFRMKSDETYSEYLSRMMQSDRQDIKPHLHFITLYETVLYSDRDITDDEIRDAENVSRTLRGIVSKSRLKYRILLLFIKQ